MPAAAQLTGHAGAAFGKAKSHVSCPAGVDCDTDTGAAKLFVGGRIDENFGGEITFLQTQDFNRSTGGELNMRAINFGALAGIPVSANGWLFGKVGILLGHTEIGSAIGDGWGASFGVGGMLSVTRRLGLRLDWDRYRIKMPPVGNDRENFDLLTLGVQYHFGEPR